MEEYTTSFQQAITTKNAKELRLLLGDQLSRRHSWFRETQEKVLYIMMEVPSEIHIQIQHYQKTLAVFSAMRSFAQWLESQGHRVIYLTLGHKENRGSFLANIQWLQEESGADLLAYQSPDDFRVAEILSGLPGRKTEVSSEHFLSDSQDFSALVKGDRPPKMETFYRRLRKKTGYLMDGDRPWGGKWNYDKQNQQGAAKLEAPEVELLHRNLKGLWAELQGQGVQGFGNPKAEDFPWPANEEEALFYLDQFIQKKMENFGTFQDAMLTGEPFLYHSLLSFAMNTKILSPRFVIERCLQHYLSSPEPHRRLASLEGFIRQILGWREYMRQFYRFTMPNLAKENYFGHSRPLPSWYWTGESKMRCAADAVKGSLENAYAHHIQRLMITGNLALLLEVDPQEVEAWYYGIYIDAFDWVEKPNTLAMSQYAEGGLMATKPYISSGKYVQKMSNHCKDCFYSVKDLEGEKACPFNALYWDFIGKKEGILAGNQRMSLILGLYRKFNPEKKARIRQKAQQLRCQADEL